MGNDTYSLTDYQKGFNDYNNFIIIINKPYKNYFKGYFVEKPKYENFKKQYEALLTIEQQKKLYHQELQEKDLQILEQYRINTEKVESLKTNLLNGKEYILINEGLYQLICKKNEEEKKNLAILYSDIKDVIICDQKDNKQILRLKKNENNIFNKSSLYLSHQDSIANSSQQTANINNSTNIANINNTNNTTNNTTNSPIDNYNKMSQDIINFYLNEKKISEFLNCQSKNNYKGFLVEESWVKNWKNHYSYEIIESNYLKNKINENQITSIIPNISAYLSYKQINNIYQEDISKYILNDVSKIETVDKSYILLDEKFMNTYRNISDIMIKPNNFIISKNNIKLENSPLNFNTDRNYLNKINSSNSSIDNNKSSQNTNNSNNYLAQPNNNINNAEISLLHSHLLKYEFSKKEYCIPNSKFKIAFAIDYNLIKKLIDFNNSIKTIGNPNNQVKEINYQNAIINNQLNSNAINNFNIRGTSIQDITNLNSEINNFSILQMFNKQPNILYINNFVLIDQEFLAFLLQKINKNIKTCLVYYILIRNKFLMVLKLEQTFMYQISSFNNNENFIAEYIIFSNYPTIDISGYILKIISIYEIQSIINMSMPIFLGNNIPIYIYQINNNNQNQIANVQNKNIGESLNKFGLEKIISDDINAKTYFTRSHSNQIPLKFNNNQPFTKSINPQISINNSTMVFNADKNLNKVNNMALDNKQVYEPSDRLKTMILLAASQQYYISDQKERVYLMSHEWLKEYKYNDIKEIVLKILNSRRCSWNTSYNFDSISGIIQLFGQENLKKYDEKVLKKRNIPFIPSLNPIQLPNKYIDSYKKFVLINDKMYEHFKRSFAIIFPTDNIYYIHKKSNLDYLCFQNYQLKNQYNPNNIQNYILIGNINRENNKFIVSYILDYNDKNIIEQEMQYFIQRDIQNYFQDKIVLTNQYEIFSPIFDNNQIIGNYYNISKNFDPKKCVNYSSLLSNNQLWANIYLYYNEITIASKLKNPSVIDEEFYLINKNLLTVIKTQNNYGQVKKYLEGKINYKLPGQKDLYNIMKTLPQNELNYLSNNLRQAQIPPANNSYEIETIPVPNPNNPNELYWVLDNFELIEKQIANEYLKNKYPYHIMKCSILGNNTIVFHYPNNKFNNIKCMFLVSKIDSNNNFINEYLLIYEPKYANYFGQIKKDLNKYLSSQYYINSTAPIVIGAGNQIGTIINLTGKQSQMSTTTPTTPISSKAPTPIHTTPIPTPGREEEYFPTNNFATNDSFKDFPSKPLVGFDNIGATCYMNATLQCLSNIKKFVDYFKYNPHLIQIVKNDTKKEKLCSAFKLVIEKLYNYKASNSYKTDLQKKGIYSQKIDLKSSYPPNNFKEIISIKNPLFKGIAANDAKDLVNFFIMTLHEELNRATPDASNNASNILLDQRNQAQMLQIFSDNFRKNYRSIISDLFYAMNCNITQCTNCNTVSYNYQVYFFLIFPLEEVRKFKLMNNGGNNNNYLNNMVDIYDCFDYDKKISVMDGDNSMYCNYCKMTCPSSMCTLLTTGPEILIIILNRGQGIQFNVKINFHLELNLMNYIQLNNTGCNYELFGVITHIGTSDMGGHFIAYCKSYFKNDYNKWYRFNDSLVTPVNDFNKEVIQFAMPYLLFYKKKS